MTVLEAYQGLLREVDKYESASFEPSDFDYWFNSALDLYLSGSLPTGEVVQKGADRMEYFVIYGKTLTQHDTDVSLYKLTDLSPAYRHVWVVKAVFQWLSDFAKYKKDSQITLYPKRRRSNRRGYQEDNAYQRPSHRYPLYELYNDGTDRWIRMEAGSRLQAQSCTLDYVKETLPFTLDSPTTSLPVPDYMAKEVIRLTARLFLENIESPRYGTQLQERQLRNE